MTPTFKVGDVVTFELCNSGLTPRWNFNEDLGGSNLWLTGKVRYIHETIMEIASTYPNNDLDTWTWPIEGDIEYRSDQWNRPGYLRHPHKYDIVLNSRAEITNGSNI